MVNRWKIAQTGTTGLSQDPRISLMNFIKNNWALVCQDPAIGNITVDTKLKNNSKQYSITIEKMPTVNRDDERTIGNGRKTVRENYRIYISAKGFGSIDKSWKMVQALDDLIDCNQTALQTDGIDWMKVLDFDILQDNTEEVIRKGQATSNNITTYLMNVELTYDKYL